MFKHNQHQFKQVTLQLKTMLSGHLLLSAQSHSHKIELTFLTRAVRSWTKSLRRLCRVCSSRDWKRRLVKCQLSGGAHWIYCPSGTRPSPQTSPHLLCKPTMETAVSLHLFWPAHHTWPPLHPALPQHEPKVQRLGTQWTINQNKGCSSAVFWSEEPFFPLNHKNSKVFSSKFLVGGGVLE